MIRKAYHICPHTYVLKFTHDQLQDALLFIWRAWQRHEIGLKETEWICDDLELAARREAILLYPGKVNNEIR